MPAGFEITTISSLEKRTQPRSHGGSGREARGAGAGTDAGAGADAGADAGAEKLAGAAEVSAAAFFFDGLGAAASFAALGAASFFGAFGTFSFGAFGPAATAAK